MGTLGRGVAYRSWYGGGCLTRLGVWLTRLGVWLTGKCGLYRSVAECSVQSRGEGDLQYQGCGLHDSVICIGVLLSARCRGEGGRGWVMAGLWTITTSL